MAYNNPMGNKTINRRLRTDGCVTKNFDDEKYAKRSRKRREWQSLFDFFLLVFIH